MLLEEAFLTECNHSKLTRGRLWCSVSQVYDVSLYPRLERSSISQFSITGKNLQIYPNCLSTLCSENRSFWDHLCHSFKHNLLIYVSDSVAQIWTLSKRQSNLITVQWFKSLVSMLIYLCIYADILLDGIRVATAKRRTTCTITAEANTGKEVI